MVVAEYDIESGITQRRKESLRRKEETPPASINERVLPYIPDTKERKEEEILLLID